MKYIIWFNHMINAMNIDNCLYIERQMEYDDETIKGFCCTDSMKCPKCGEMLYASSYVLKKYEAYPTSEIDWSKYIVLDKRQREKKLKDIYQYAIPEYQKLLKLFLENETNFNGFLLSGTRGPCSRYYDNSKQIYLRNISAVTLFHELGHALMDMNGSIFDSYYEAFLYESKNSKTIKLLKNFLETKTNLSQKYDNIVQLGYFNGSRSRQIDEEYWAWFEARLVASQLYGEILDIFGSITNKKYKCYTYQVGHSVSYYRRTLPNEEFFANYLSIRAVNDRLQIDILNKVFPNTTHEYDIVIEKLKNTYEG